MDICSCIFFLSLEFRGLYLSSSTQGHFSPSCSVFVHFALVCWGWNVLRCILRHLVVICVVFYYIVLHCLVWRWMLFCCVVSRVVALNWQLSVSCLVLISVLSGGVLPSNTPPRQNVSMSTKTFHSHEVLRHHTHNHAQTHT